MFSHFNTVHECDGQNYRSIHYNSDKNMSWCNSNKTALHCSTDDNVNRRSKEKINAQLTRHSEYAHLAVLPDFVLRQQERQQHQQPTIIFINVQSRSHMLSFMFIIQQRNRLQTTDTRIHSYELLTFDAFK